MVESHANLDYDRLFDVISHSDRRMILKYLYENIEASYSDILRSLNLESGHLNFHLRKLKDFICKTDDGTYMLTVWGKTAYEAVKSVEYLKGNTIPINRSSIPQLMFPKRAMAFALDAIIFFFSLGLFLDANTYVLAGWISDLFEHLLILDLAYVFNHLGMIARSSVAHYSHVFLTVYIVFTILEAYRGQTLGKYLLRIRVVKIAGRKISFMESSIRNLGKVFFLPLDLLLGLLFYRRVGFLRFFDYYTQTTLEQIK